MAKTDLEENSDHINWFMTIVNVLTAILSVCVLILNAFSASSVPSDSTKDILNIISAGCGGVVTVLQGADKLVVKSQKKAETLAAAKALYTKNAAAAPVDVTALPFGTELDKPLTKFGVLKIR